MLSYKTKNILGLLLIFVPSAGFIFSHSFLLSNAFFVVSLVIGILCESMLYRIFSLPLWLSFNISFFAFSALTITYFPDNAAAYISYVLLGFCSGGLIFILPPNIIIGWFFYDKARTMGYVTSIGILLSLLSSFLFNTAPALFTIISFISMVFSSLIIIQSPPHITVDVFLDGTRHNKKNRLKLSAFFFLISLSLTFAYIIGYDSVSFIFNFSAVSAKSSVNGILTVLSMAAGPVVSSMFINKKGIYAGSVLLIFLSELSVMCAGFYSSRTFMSYIGCIAFGAAASSSMVICPLSVYYMMGCSSYNKNLGVISSFMPLGSAFLLLYNNAGSEDFLSSQSVISVLFILAVSFFTIFSAWKHRLVLLK